MSDLLRNEYRPADVSPPGDTLRDLLEERGISQAYLAARTGRAKKTINEIIQGKAPITTAMALDLELALGIEAEFWNRREQLYREHLERLARKRQLAQAVGWAGQFPTSAMVRCGWIKRASNNSERVREILQFFGVASPDQWSEIYADDFAAFRCSAAFRIDRPALSAWLRQGERLAESVHCRPFDAKGFRAALTRARALTTQPFSVSQLALRGLCAAYGVVVVFVPEMPKSRVSGATRWLTPDKALIQLSLRYKTDDHLWFTFFHEAAHVLQHRKKAIYLEGIRSKNADELAADRLAADMLIPPDHWAQFIRSGISKQRVRSFADELGIAPGIVVGRLQHEGAVGHDWGNEMKRRLQWAKAA